VTLQPPGATWLVIPVMAVACAAIATAIGTPVIPAVAVGALGAAIAGAVRAFTGPSLAGAVCAATAALVGVATTLDLHDPALARAALAGAAAMFAIAELARLMSAPSPWPAIGAAIVAAVLDPSFVGLVAITGARLVTGPWVRPRWAIGIVIVGGAAIVAAAIAALAHTRLWIEWTGTTPRAASPAAVATLVGDALGPLIVIAAVAGLVTCVTRGRFAAASVVAIAAGALAVALVDGALAPSSLAVAALAAGVAIARLAAMVRWPAGQLLVGASAGLMMLVAPALTLAR
jgi:hypothetical protein